MNEDVKARFKALGNFPSPPGIAQEIIELAKSEEVSIGEVSGAIAKDPALAAKVLRMANSALYAQRRRSQNLRQALTMMGLDAAMTLCLGFSIAGSFRSTKAGAIDYTRYWRRSRLAGLGGRCMGDELGLPSCEELFLGGLPGRMTFSTIGRRVIAANSVRRPVIATPFARAWRASQRRTLQFKVLRS